MTKPWEKRQSTDSVKAKHPAKKYNRGEEAMRAVMGGATFGFYDEMKAAENALKSVATTGQTIAELPAIYDEEWARLKESREAYRDERPVEATLAEVGGGIATGIAGGIKMAGTEVGKRFMANTPRWMQASALAAPQSALYGAGTADPGERLQSGAVSGLVGAVAAPIVGFAADKVGSTLGAVGRWAKNKLSSTPRKEAIQAIRTALAAEGLDPDEAVAIYQRLGPQATMADIGENFRAAARVAVDIPGATKSQARQLMNDRQMGQQSRLMGAAQEAVGQKADDLLSTVKQIATRRAEQAKPAYDAAFEQGAIAKSEALDDVLSRPAMKRAMAQAKAFAENMGDTFDPGSLKHLHYAKMALDELNKQRKFPRDLMQLKTDLLKAMDDAAPLYREARQQFAGDSALMDAANAGRAFLKTPPDELKDLAQAMTAGEKDMFKLGAMAGIQDLMDSVRHTHDATQRLIGNDAQLKRLANVFDSEAAAKKFLEAAWREAEMGRTRAVLTGGSPTAERLAGKKWLEDAVQPESITAFAGGPMAMAMEAAKQVLQKQPLSQQALDEMGRVLLQQGMPADEVRKILTSPRTMQVITNLNREFITRAGAAGAVPALTNTPVLE